mmetsp:Transcript_139222/g.444974  ORF Transcript_139222/g.444974 Transcript_139222/m.444974 type:complete len:215 (-) Transcript_139222:620-1264(-)
MVRVREVLRILAPKLLKDHLFGVATAGSRNDGGWTTHGLHLSTLRAFARPRLRWGAHTRCRLAGATIDEVGPPRLALCPARLACTPWWWGVPARAGGNAATSGRIAYGETQVPLGPKSFDIWERGLSARLPRGAPEGPRSARPPGGLGRVRRGDWRRGGDCQAEVLGRHDPGPDSVAPPLGRDFHKPAAELEFAGGREREASDRLPDLAAQASG